jgi:predicted DNA-binding protein
MKKEYDFSSAEQGRFYRKAATLRLPIYLGPELQTKVATLAKRTGRELGDVVNQIVENEMRLLDDLAVREQDSEGT